MGFKSGARGGRLKRAMDPLAEAMNASIEFDRRLAHFDIRGSIAHAQMLEEVGVLDSEEVAAICDGLKTIGHEIAKGNFPLDPALEDIHMNIEDRLIKRIGTPGMRLHTARSRNDQVATDLKLYALHSAKKLIQLLRVLRKSFVTKAQKYKKGMIPGYTHLQRAQPVTIGHHLLAYEAMFHRDQRRLQTYIERVSRSPLGAGALATTTFNIDRTSTAKKLGFRHVMKNSMDAVSDRDFVLDLLHCVTTVGIHLSRLGEELVLWTSKEFQFASIGPAYCSTSSIMPQKANADIAELLRGKVGRLIGSWVAVATVCKGLPLAYNKDLQETQEPMFDAVETSLQCVEVAAKMVSSLKFHVENTEAAVTNSYALATELADYLAQKGVPFREAHHAVGALVHWASTQNRKLNSLKLTELRKFHDAFARDVFPWIDAEVSINRRNNVGGPAIKQISLQLRELKKELTDVPTL